LAFSFYIIMNINDCYKVGYVLKPHGLKGEVTIAVDPEFPEDITDIESIFVEQKAKLVPYFFQSISFNGDKAFVKFEDVDTQEAANSISKSALYLPKSSRPKSGRNEFYDDEIIDFEMHDKELGMIGKVSGVQQAGPNKLIEILHEGKEVLIPVNGPFIKGINKSKRLITVELPEGFLEI
jgi:16S rRNA processing protein RimM